MRPGDISLLLSEDINVNNGIIFEDVQLSLEQANLFKQLFIKVGEKKSYILIKKIISFLGGIEKAKNFFRTLTEGIYDEPQKLGNDLDSVYSPNGIHPDDEKGGHINVHGETYRSYLDAKSYDDLPNSIYDIQYQNRDKTFPNFKGILPYKSKPEFSLIGNRHEKLGKIKAWFLSKGIDVSILNIIMLLLLNLPVAVLSLYLVEPQTVKVIVNEIAVSNKLEMSQKVTNRTLKIIISQNALQGAKINSQNISNIVGLVIPDIQRNIDVYSDKLVQQKAYVMGFPDFEYTPSIGKSLTNGYWEYRVVRNDIVVDIQIPMKIHYRNFKGTINYVGLQNKVFHIKYESIKTGDTDTRFGDETPYEFK